MIRSIGKSDYDHLTTFRAYTNVDNRLKYDLN